MADIETPVSRQEFNSLANSVSDLVSLIRSDRQAKTPAVDDKHEKEVAKAGPNAYTSNPEWEELAREIIGEAVDHTEIEYVKGGGMKFTVVIKQTMSNASVSYLEVHKIDRRTKEIGSEGEAGVRVWCELIKNNLKRDKPVTA